MVESTGSTNQHSNDDPARNGHSLPQPVSSFSCPHCPRSFNTKSGRGLHIRKSHPDDFDQAHLRVDKNVRWSVEEASIFARKEAEIITSGGSRNINQELASCFPHRTLDAVKGQRRKEDHRTAVQRFIQEQTRPQQPPAEPQPPAGPTNGPDNFIEFLIAQPPPRANSYNSQRLCAIINQAKDDGRDITSHKLATYLLDVLPPKRRANHHTTEPDLPPRPLNRRQQRRREYAITQRNWSKHQNRCIKSLLDVPDSSKMPNRSLMEPFWRNILQQEGTNCPPNEHLEQSLNNIWEPITMKEIQDTRPPISTSPGPDGMTARQLRAIPADVLMRIYNLILWCQKVPPQYRQSKTIFIPKKVDSKTPDEFRPITISPVLIRHLHSILAKRLVSSLSLDPRQRAFLPTDGCSQNITLMDLLLRDANNSHKSLYMASLDVSKAFDSVTHNTILGTVESYGLPDGFISYLREYYNTSATCLVGDNWTSIAIQAKRGVKQGDPLSPTLFNMVIDRLLKKLPEHIGYSLGQKMVNAAAFADDVTLFSSTPQGLQILLDQANSFLSACGLSLNRAKCFTLGIKGQPKQKQAIVEQRTFTLSGQELPARKRTEQWKYLGVHFTADGRSKYKVADDLIPKLERLTKAPLKPQQRLHALRTVLIPQLYHRLVLGNVMIGCLNKTDTTIRRYIKKWLNLPIDTPSAFFYTTIAQGGLGIPSLRWNAPCLRKQRLLALDLYSNEGCAVVDTFVARELSITENRLRAGTQTLSSKKDIENYWADKLYASIDGSGLRESGSHPQAHRWIREPTRLLGGRDFINCIRVRINALPSRSRTSRGRNSTDRSCRACAAPAETTNHIVQQCPRTHGPRIERHNSIIKYIKRSLNNRGFTTFTEPRFDTAEGLRKPDLIGVKDSRAVVIDAQVVTDGRSLDDAHFRKKGYYDRDSLKLLIMQRYRARETTVTTATLNWRGVWSGASVDDLIKNNIINKRDTAIVSTRTAIGTLSCFRAFNNTTTVYYRQGIG